MRPLSLAIISDLHFGRHARSKDLCPHTDGPTKDEGFATTFFEFVHKNNIRADFLILPGDIAEMAHPEEVSLASTFVKKAAQKLGVNQRNIVFVPGNHDVDWSVLGAGTSPVRWNQRYDPVRYRDFVFRKLVGSRPRNVLDDPYIAFWNFGDVQIIGYNSSWHDNKAELVHHGKIDLAHLTQLEAILKEVDVSPNVLRLFLVHHHPVSYDNPVAGEPDFSQMVNNERLFSLLSEHYFDLIVHGHTHQPRFQVYQRDGSLPMGILASGSFSLELPHQWSGKVANQFHMIRLHGRNNATHFVEGVVESWAYYYSHGWTQSSSDRDGISHREAFGTYLDPHRCRDILRGAIDRHLLTADWVKWTSLVAEEPSFGYLRPERVNQALRELAPVSGFDIHVRGDEIILLRK